MRFSALRAPWYKGYLTGGTLLMAGDHVEHAISYFVMWQLFQSPLLARIAVVTHWVPHLLFGVFFGRLADRYDCRRIIQAGQALFVLVSLGWAFLIAYDALEPWNCVVLLTLHGLASVVWTLADQVMLYEIAGPKDIASAIRLSTTGRNLGQFIGPVVGAALLFTVGPVIGMLVNIALHLPFIVYLMLVPYDGHSRSGAGRQPRMTLVQGFGVLREVRRYPAIVLMLILQGAFGLFIGSALLPLLPEFGALLGQDDSGLGYGALISALSFGAAVAGVALEAAGRVRTGARMAVLSTAVLAASLLGFAFSRDLLASIALLVLAGMATLVSMSSSQTVVQLTAPDDKRGRFLGAYTMIGSGLRAGSGVMIGVLGGIVGVAGALAIDAAALLVVTLVLLAVVLRLQASRRIGPDRDIPTEDEATGEL